MHEPEQLRGAGMSGPRESVSAQDATRRRMLMTQLLVTQLDQDQIVATMQREFGMDEASILHLEQLAKQRLLKESDENKPYKKAMAEKRIANHIVKASKKNQWGAVANLETTLSRIQGTESPVEIHTKTDIRLSVAAMHVLGGMNQDELHELIESEIKELRLLDTHGEEVD